MTALRETMDSSMSTLEEEGGTYVIPTVKNPDLINKAKALNHVPWCEEYEKMISGMRCVSAKRPRPSISKSQLR